MSKREPDGWIAEYKGDASRYGEFNVGKYIPICLSRDDLHREYGNNSAWQIRPVWLSTEPPEEWISAKERLPEESGSYLCIRFNDDSGCSLDYCADYRGWNVGPDGNRDSELFPLYWRPLPPPPGKEGEK